MKINVNKGILDKANKLINPIACGIARLKESEQAMGGKPTINFSTHREKNGANLSWTFGSPCVR